MIKAGKYNIYVCSLSSLEFSEWQRRQDDLCYSQQAPFDYTWIYINQVTLGDRGWLPTTWLEG